jgi:hypothetical protein
LGSRGSQIPGQPGLPSEILSQKKEKEKEKLAHKIGLISSKRKHEKR